MLCLCVCPGGKWYCHLWADCVGTMISSIMRAVSGRFLIQWQKLCIKYRQHIGAWNKSTLTSFRHWKLQTDKIFSIFFLQIRNIMKRKKRRWNLRCPPWNFRRSWVEHSQLNRTNHIRSHIITTGNKHQNPQTVTITHRHQSVTRKNRQRLHFKIRTPYDQLALGERG